MNDLHLPFRVIQQFRAPDDAISASIPAQRPLRRASRLLSLEPRFMFDGAAVATAAHGADAKADAHAAALAAEAAAAASVHQVRDADASANNGKKEVVFVDTSVADYRTLEAGVPAGVAVVEYDGSKDGLAQIAAWAQNNSGYDAIHILSHGSEGTLNLGTDILNDASLSSATVQAELADIGHALNAGGDILLYGCDVAAGSDGQQFIADLARITGADVAASTNATGDAGLGGDWTLEAHTGKIDARAVEITGYHDLLTVITFTDADADYTSTTVTKQVNGVDVTFTGGTSGGDGLGVDDVSVPGEAGLYAWDASKGPSDPSIKLTVSIQPGYEFDIRSFDTVVWSGSLTVSVTYADGSSGSFTLNDLSTGTFTPLSSVAGSLEHATQVVLTSNDFGLFQNFDIENVQRIPTAPVVTDGHISISSIGSGTGGAYKIGDVVTATWNNTAGGDNNADVSGVTMDFSQFGGPSSVSATNSAGTWTASYTITAANLDAVNRNVSVSATNAVGSTTTADSTNLTVDASAPTVTDGNIYISGGTGTGGVYKIGDTVTVTWNNTAGGDSNTDTVSGVTVDFSAFGGGSAVAAFNSGGTWTATYTIVSGTIEATNRNVVVTVTDNAGNRTTTSDTTNATVDNARSSALFGNLSLSPDTGASNQDFVTNTAAVAVSATLDNALQTGDRVQGSLDNGATWTDITGMVSGTTLTWVGVTLPASGTLSLRVVDAAGNTGTASSHSYVVDTVAPAAPSVPAMSSGSDTGASFYDGITSSTTPVFTGTAESGSTVTLYDTDGVTVLGSTTATGGAWSITSAALAAGSHTITAKATDTAGNVSVASTGAPVMIDTAAPTNLALDTTSVGAAGAGASIATLSSFDNTSVTYSLAAGNGANDADNGSFSIAGGVLHVGGASLSAGAYRIYVAATDAAGNVSQQAFTITVTEAPSVVSIVRAGGASQAVDASTTSLSYTVTFSEAVTGVDAGDFVLVATGGAFGAVAAVSGSGSTYTVTVDHVAGDGTLRLDLKSSGTGIRNGSSVDIIAGYSSGQTYTLDHTAPAAPSTPAMSADTGTSGSDGITKISTQTFTGTAESGAVVTLYDSDGTTVLGSATAAGGSWLIADVALAAGSHVITAKAVDAAGNVSAASAGLAVTIDQTSPTVVITSSASSLKAGESATITFTFSEDPGASFTLGDLTATNGVLSSLAGSGLVRTVIFTPVAGMNGGVAIISIAGGAYADAAGNLGTGAILPGLLIDTLAPNAPSTPVLNPADDRGLSGTDGITNATTPTFSGTAEAGATVTLYDTDGTTVLGSTVATSGAWQIITSALGEGTHTITARATDAAGNRSNASSGASITIDTTAPTAAISSMTLSSDTGSSSTDFITKTASQTVSGMLSAPLQSGERVQVSLDDGATWIDATSSVGSTAWSSSVTLSGSGVLRVMVVDAAGNASAQATHSYVLDTDAPTVDSVAVPANGTYTANENLDFVVNFSEAVTVDTTGGTPRIALAVGTTVVYAYYESGSGTNAILFRYTVAVGDQDANGITVGALNPNGGTIRDLAGNDAVPTLNNLGSTAGVDVDAAQPSITSVTSTTANGLYKAGDSVTIELTFSGAVDVDTAHGTPMLALNNGGVARYLAGSGSNVLTFTYTIGAGQDVADLDYSAIGALSLNGAAIMGASGSHANALLTLAAPGAAGSLGANKDIVIDATPPMANFGGLALSADTGVSDADFITSAAGQTITATLNQALGSGDRAYGSLDNGATWVDITGMVSGTSLAWNGVTLAGNGTIVLRVVDAAGNAGVEQAQAYVLDVTPPAAPTVDAVQSSSTAPVLSGDATLAAGETLTVTVGGAVYDVVPADGHWQLDLASAVPASGSIALAAGVAYDVTATVTDAAGNGSSATGAFSIAAPPPPPSEGGGSVEPTPPSPPAPPVVVLPPPLPRPPAPIFSSVEPLPHSGQPSSGWSTAGVTPPTALPPDVSDASSAVDASAQSVLVSGNLNALVYSQPPVDHLTSLIEAVRDQGRTEPGIMSHGDGFHVVIVPASPGFQGLMLYQGIGARLVQSGGTAFDIPSDAFAHTDPNATVRLSAGLADGKPLPAWLRFDGSLGRFVANPPSGLVGDIAIRVVARDGAGKEAVAVFHLRVGAAHTHADVRGDSFAGARSAPEQAGRAALTEQLQQAARQRGGAGALDRLAHLARALHSPNA